MTVLATLSPADEGLAHFDASLQLGEAEPLGAGVKRVTMEQLELAAAGFFDAEAGFGTAVHESRKAIKRVRALLRMVRGEIPGKIYAFESASLRDTAHLMASVRSSQGVLNAVTSIQALYGELLATGTFDELATRLVRRRDLSEIAAVEDPNLVGRVVRSLERAYQRYSAWPTDPEAREVYGIGISDTYQALEPGVGQTYRDGRRRMASAYRIGGTGDFHAWRKRVKDFRHQMEFLAPLWPEVLVGTAMTANRLGDLLGEDNDLAELGQLMTTRPDLCPDSRERSLLRALTRQRRIELQTASEILGRRIYAEQADGFSGRLGEYWGARKMAIEGPLDTIVVY